ncbi:MAG: Alpha-tectorin precursor [Phycisphaerales bacterium]|nr:Alpha-tectorin precursor [Phycisphaerales bacterium]
MSWNPVAGEDGYRLSRIDDGAWTTLAEIPSGTTSYRDTGLSANTSYQYRIVAIGSAGDSDPNDPVYGLTLPTAPTGVSASAQSGHEIDLTWSVTSGAANELSVEQMSASGNFMTIATLGATATQYNVTGLEPSTSYEFRVVAENSAGRSPSDPANATTKPVDSGTLDPNDDSFKGPVDIGFPVDFYGKHFTQLYVNNNGNINFNGGSGTYSPSGPLTDIYGAIIAPFFADVDTRPTDPTTDNTGGTPNGTVSYSSETVDGHRAFAVHWVDVGYYTRHAQPTDTFDMDLVDRSDIAAGDFDINFHYGSIGWDTGDASGGSGGVADPTNHSPSPARIGYSNGTGLDGTYYELPESGVAGAFLGSGPGDQHFEIRNAQATLTAYRTGDNYGAAVTNAVKNAGDPTQYVILTNNNFDEHPDMSQPDNADSTALIGTDHDLARITLHQLNPMPAHGTVSLELSNPSAVRLFKSDGTELTADEVSADVTSPSAYLAGLAGGDVDVYVEGLTASSDEAISVVYRDGQGNEVSRDSVHMLVADWNFVGKDGAPVNDVANFDMENLIRDAEGNSQDPMPANEAYFKIKIDGLSTNSVTELRVISGADTSEYYDDHVVSNGSGIESADFGILYSSSASPDEGAGVLTPLQRDDVQKHLQLNAVHNGEAHVILATANDKQERALPAKFKYTTDDLRAALANDATYGTAVKFLLNEMDRGKFKFVVEPLNDNFKGTPDGAYVNSNAATIEQAKSWAMNALRQWAGFGVQIEKTRNPGPNAHYFADIARRWARHFYWQGDNLDQVPANPDPKACTNSLGETLNFLLLFSGRGSDLYNPYSPPTGMYPLKDPGNANGKPDAGVFELYLWVFSNRHAIANSEKSSWSVNIPPKLGMHHDYFEADARKPLNLTIHANVPPDPDGTWPNEDQMHHFVGYFFFGGTFLLGTTDVGLAKALKATGDYPSAENPGDYYLGIVAAELGSAFFDKPTQSFGNFVEKVLGWDWKTAFRLLGRAATDLP